MNIRFHVSTCANGLKIFNRKVFQYILHEVLLIGPFDRVIMRHILTSSETVYGNSSHILTECQRIVIRSLFLEILCGPLFMTMTTHP